MFRSSSLRRYALMLTLVVASLTVRADNPPVESEPPPSAVSSPAPVADSQTDDTVESADSENSSHFEIFSSSVLTPLKLQIDQFVYQILAVLALVIPVVILFFLGPILILLIKQYVAVCALKTEDEIEELFEDVEDNGINQSLDGESLWDEAAAYAGLEDVDEIDVDDCLDDSDIDRAKESADHVW